MGRAETNIFKRLMIKVYKLMSYSESYVEKETKFVFNYFVYYKCILINTFN